MSSSDKPILRHKPTEPRADWLAWSLHLALGFIAGGAAGMFLIPRLMNLRYVGIDELHLVIVGLGGIVFLFEAGFAASALGKGFRVYTLATVLASLVFGYITSSSAADVQANEPTPWVGIYERVSAYGYELWLVVLAVSLWQLRGRVGGLQRGK